MPQALASVAHATRLTLCVFGAWRSYIDCILPVAKRVCYAPTIAVKALRTPGHLRTPVQLHFLRDLTKQLGFVRQLPPHIVASLVRELRYLHAHAGDCVVRQGDPGDEFCIIINGAVGVFVMPESGALTVSTSNGRFGSKHTQYDSEYGDFVARLTAGDSFGESALATYPEPSRRNASVVALGDVALATLSIESFAKIFGVSEPRSP